MIPVLTRSSEAVPLYVAFCTELAARGSAADFSATEADRTVFSTDNSIYQVELSAVACTRGRDDVIRIAKLLTSTGCRASWACAPSTGAAVSSAAP